MEVDEEGFVSFDIAAMATRESYRLLVAAVAPRPIALVSTVSTDGVRNLAPFSFFMAGGANPLSLAVSPLLNSRTEAKDTLENVRATGEMVVNVVTWPIREGTNAASAEVGPEVDEWELAGFTATDSHLVRPQRVAESPISMECRLFTVVSHGSGPLSANYIIAEVVRIHVSSSVMSGGQIDPLRVDYIGRMAGDWYCRAAPESMFELKRP